MIINDVNHLIFFIVMMYCYLTNGGSNKGYTTSVKALAATETNPTIIDASELEQGKSIPEESILVSAGNMGFQLFKQYGAGHPMVLATDRYGFEDLSQLQTSKLVIIAPQSELKKYETENLPYEVIRLVADLTAAPAKEIMNDRSRVFFEQNMEQQVGRMAMAELYKGCDPRFFFFFGGRVFAPIEKEPNRWLENSVEQFKRTAETLMEHAKGRDTLVVFHGLRSRTKSNGSDDLAPQESAIAKMSELRVSGQTVVIIATTGLGPTLIALDRDGERRYPIWDKGAGAYYAAIEMAISVGAPMEYTAEQMGFFNEALTLGADWKNIMPIGSEFGWKLCLPANEETHEKVIKELSAGKTPLDQVQAFHFVRNVSW